MNTIRAERVSCCPICGGKSTTKGKNGFILCSLHLWQKGIKGIEITHTNKH